MKLSKEEISDILITAFEGGINYWCGAVRIKKDPGKKSKLASDVISNNGELELSDAESDDVWILDREKLQNGFEKTLDFYKISKDTFFENIDADYTDVCIQFSLFNEIVFG